MPSQKLVPNRLALVGFGVIVGFALGRAPLPSLVAQMRGERAEPAVPAGGPGAAEGPYDKLARQYEAFRGVDRTFEEVSKVVAPSVVHIVARKSGVRGDGSAARFEETGSGVIVMAESDQGQGRYVLTNHHVVMGAKAEEIRISLQDGRVLRPTQVWSDEKADVAVLKLPLGDLPAARMGDSDTTAVGSWVLALGSPFGLMHSVSQGIISARGRYEQELEHDGVENQDFLQTDAAINPGNSGGPLVNLKGEVIGINTAIASNGGGSEGVGFSIPINLARWALNQLVSEGRVSRGAIGVRLGELSARHAADAGIERVRGARVESVQEASPAARAGIKQGDVIVRFNGQEVVDFNHLINLVSVTPIGTLADLKVWRDREMIDLQVTVADRREILGEPPARAARPGALLRRPRSPEATAEADAALPGGLADGLALAAIDAPEVAERYGLNRDQRGLLVVKVEPDSAFAQVLQPSDLIQAVDGETTQSVERFRMALNKSGPHSIQFERTENGQSQVRIIEIDGS